MTRSKKIKKGMDIKPMRRRCLVLVAVITCAMLLWGNDVILAIEDDQTRPPENAELQFPRPDEQETIKGYPAKQRRIGTPTDVEWDLDNSFPKRGSVLELILRCRENQEQ